MAEYLAGRHDSAMELENHFDECASCREEFESMSRTWERMSAWPDEEPGPAVRARFYQMLEAYEEGRRAAKPVERASWWNFRPALQFALAAGLVIAGVFVGSNWKWNGGADGEVATLRSEVQSMRQLVALSLLQQQSASDRLRGVTWSYRVEPDDTEVLSALLRTVNTDANVNVRLAAVDALRPFTNNPVGRRGVAQSLRKQSSPLVQIALLGMIREVRDNEAVDEIRALAEDAEVDPTVRERARQVAASLTAP
jgi:hypothetical protein